MRGFYHDPSTKSNLPLHVNVQQDLLITKYFTIFSRGDASKVRTANNGFDCRVDLIHDLWGFCPTTVISATDCGLAGSCVDKHGCSKGWGFTNAALTTFTCSDPSAPFCSTALLTLPNNLGPFTYLACGKGPSTDNYMAFTTKAESSASSTTVSTSGNPQSSSTTASTLTQVDASASGSETTIPQAETIGQRGSTNGENTQTNNIGAIVGGVIGSIALLCASGIVIVWLLIRNRNSAKTPKVGVAPIPKPLETQSPDHKTVAWTHYSHAGWGPPELPAYHGNGSNTGPVELPAIMYPSRE
ncbi:uncharacterized protein QC763_0082960 [Podospora pseudopauciseta]|uniref:Mid2 domain-containing protein n=1 Tax=Podospora pseudopauciseta TaxID=2093780 RepID=A0ABR0H8C6_9PEZI|nr:hypothetical protein QC763_0082960 [Podospora pseudopauciseta]